MIIIIIYENREKSPGDMSYNKDNTTNNNFKKLNPEPLILLMTDIINSRREPL